MERLIALNSNDVMRPSRIEDISHYQRICNQYGLRGCVSNDYIQQDAARLIEQGLLYEVCGEKNAFLLVRKEGFWRVYYYLNDFNERLVVDKEELVTEILYRGAQGEPGEQVCFLENCGFKRNLTRDLFFAKYSNISNPAVSSDLVIADAISLQEVEWAATLFNMTFDKWSGDFIAPSSYQSLLDRKSVLIAKDSKGELLGAFESEVERGVNWLRHFAVTETARGRGVGKSLLDSVVEKGHVDDNSRYMLWVQQSNLPAVNMYKKKGFSYMGKSTLSMIKL